MNRKEKGNLGENIAAKYLTENGVKILEKNYRIKTGEIDIVGLDKGVLVFYEVKTRSNNNYGTPAESVNYFKQNRIKNTALEFIRETRPKFKSIRFDIIEIVLDCNLNLKNINQIINAF
ncbi:MAG: YraN family protein [Thermoanaerobacteraceae bacterium]|nr:YraN family protein [Thermoanaerobacteraceae bacterium]